MTKQVIPAEYPPPVDNLDFIAQPTDPEDERIEVGIAIVGGGPAGLACAIKLMQQLENEPELLESLGEVPVAVIEKGKTSGAHLLSGANMRPSAMQELFPDLDPSEWPVYGEVKKDAVYLLSKKRHAKLVPPPPNMKNHGNYVTSVAELGRFLAQKAEEMGVYVLSETTAQKLLVEEGKVVGVRTGDRGQDRDGNPMPNFEPGTDVIAKATVISEGTIGHLSMAAIDFFEMQPKSPQRWEIGVKEVWEVDKPLDRVIHTMGYPLRKGARYNEFGGSFIYPMGDDKVCIGLVIGLDYTDATLSCHDLLQELKLHPMIKKILKGGKRVAWGAKTIPSGGYWSIPSKLSVPGMVLTGDAAGLTNIAVLKGVHYAMHSGMYAAETIVEALKATGDTDDLSAYDRKVMDGFIGKEFYETRNMRQPFSKGFFVGGALASMMTITKGKFPGGYWKHHEDWKEPMFIGNREYPQYDGQYTFSKLDSVFASGNATRDSAPNHVKIQQKDVPREVAQTWVSLCPAQVYEIPENQSGDKVDVHVTPSNCVQCGAITAKGGRFTPPEGGDGPLYTIV